MVWPQIFASGLPGNRDEPIRAGMMAVTFMVLQGFPLQLSQLFFRVVEQEEIIDAESDEPVSGTDFSIHIGRNRLDDMDAGNRGHEVLHAAHFLQCLNHFFVGEISGDSQ